MMIGNTGKGNDRALLSVTMITIAVMLIKIIKMTRIVKNVSLDMTIVIEKAAATVMLMIVANARTTTAMIETNMTAIMNLNTAKIPAQTTTMRTTEAVVVIGTTTRLKRVVE